MRVYDKRVRFFPQLFAVHRFRHYNDGNLQHNAFAASAIFRIGRGHGSARFVPGTWESPESAVNGKNPTASVRIVLLFTQKREFDSCSVSEKHVIRREPMPSAGITSYKPARRCLQTPAEKSPE